MGTILPALRAPRIQSAGGTGVCFANHEGLCPGKLRFALKSGTLRSPKGSSMSVMPLPPDGEKAEARPRGWGGAGPPQVLLLENKRRGGGWPQEVANSYVGQSARPSKALRAAPWTSLYKVSQALERPGV